MKLRKAEHRCLVEALRRRTRFLTDATGGYAITDHWTGLGSATRYKQAVASGFMIATEPHPGYKTWWKLTARGALIVAYWIGLGYTYGRVEDGHIPPLVIPETVLDA